MQSGIHAGKRSHDEISCAPSEEEKWVRDLLSKRLKAKVSALSAMSGYYSEHLEEVEQSGLPSIFLTNDFLIEMMRLGEIVCSYKNKSFRKNIIWFISFLISNEDRAHAFFVERKIHKVAMEVLSVSHDIELKLEAAFLICNLVEREPENINLFRSEEIFMVFSQLFMRRNFVYQSEAIKLIIYAIRNNQDNQAFLGVKAIVRAELVWAINSKLNDVESKMHALEAISLLVKDNKANQDFFGVREILLGLVEVLNSGDHALRRLAVFTVLHLIQNNEKNKKLFADVQIKHALFSLLAAFRVDLKYKNDYAKVLQLIIDIASYPENQSWLNQLPAFLLDVIFKPVFNLTTDDSSYTKYQAALLIITMFNLGKLNKINAQQFLGVLLRAIETDSQWIASLSRAERALLAKPFKHNKFNLPKLKASHISALLLPDYTQLKDQTTSQLISLGLLDPVLFLFDAVLRASEEELNGIINQYFRDYNLLVRDWCGRTLFDAIQEAEHLSSDEKRERILMVNTLIARQRIEFASQRLVYPLSGDSATLSMADSCLLNAMAMAVNNVLVWYAKFFMIKGPLPQAQVFHELGLGFNQNDGVFTQVDPEQVRLLARWASYFLLNDNSLSSLVVDVPRVMIPLADVWTLLTADPRFVDVALLKRLLNSSDGVILVKQALATNHHHLDRLNLDVFLFQPEGCATHLFRKLISDTKIVLLAFDAHDYFNPGIRRDDLKRLVERFIDERGSEVDRELEYALFERGAFTFYLFMFTYRISSDVLWEHTFNRIIEFTQRQFYHYHHVAQVLYLMQESPEPTPSIARCFLQERLNKQLNLGLFDLYWKTAFCIKGFAFNWEVFETHKELLYSLSCVENMKFFLSLNDVTPNLKSKLMACFIKHAIDDQPGRWLAVVRSVSNVFDQCTKLENGIAFVGTTQLWSSSAASAVAADENVAEA